MDVHSSSLTGEVTPEEASACFTIAPHGRGKVILNCVTIQKRELFYGLIRIHVLVHASQEPNFGLAMQEELERLGYRIGPGTLYPLLHGLERAGLLRSRTGNGAGGSRRRTYTITAAGRKALDRARTKVDELHHELHEAHPRMGRMPDEAGRASRNQSPH